MRIVLMLLLCALLAACALPDDLDRRERFAEWFLRGN